MAHGPQRLAGPGVPSHAGSRRVAGAAPRGGPHRPGRSDGFGASGVPDDPRALDAASDEELAVRAQGEKLEGRTASFEELVRRLEGPLHGFLRVRVGNAAEAEELVQEAFLRAWTKLERYDPRWRFTTWLYTVAKRLAVSRARSRRPDELSEEALGGLCSGADPFADSAHREEVRNLWDLAAEVLSREQRSALWLRYAEDLSNEEIAAVLGKKRVTVRVLLFRARQALARAVARADEWTGTPARAATAATSGEAR